MKNITKIALGLIMINTFSMAGTSANELYSKVTIDELEYQDNSEKNVAWDTNLWIGDETDKLYFYTEGEKPKDGIAQSENQLVYSKAIAPFWDAQFGVGYDKAGSNNQTWGVLSIQGLAPYFFETRTSLLVGQGGNVGLRFDAEYEALFTQKLILTPSIAIDAYSKDDLSMGLGKGLSNITAGMRLRYEIKREFAPYVGVEWSKNFGNTADISPLNESYVVGGVRVWF